MALTWTSDTLTPAAFIFGHTFWADSLGLFIIMNYGDGVSSPMPYITTSPDGTTWTARFTQVPTVAFDALHWNEYTNRAILIGQHSTCYQYSSDGINWSSGGPPPLYGANQRLVMAGNASITIALGYGNSTTQDLIYSTDSGVSWGNGTCVAGVWQAAAWSPTLGLFAVVGDPGGTNEVMTSSDGTTWTARTPSTTGFDWDSLVWAPSISKFIAFSSADGRSMTSSDGTTWTVSADLGLAGVEYRNLTWSDDLTLAVAIKQSSGADVDYIYSSNGTTWTTATTNPVLNDFSPSVAIGGRGGAWSPDLATFVWVSSNSTLNAILAEEGAVSSTGWYKSDVPGISTGVDATSITGASARPKGPRGQIELSPFSDSNPLFGYPGHAIAFQNRMIYATGDYTIGTDLPPIRVWNGTSDYQLAVIPKDGSGNIPKCITTISNADGSIYLGTWDTGTSNADVAGRILKLDPNSGQLTNVGNVNSLTGYIPWALKFHNGELWTGLHRSDTSAGRIYRIKPNEQTTWTQDRDLTTDSVGPCTVIESYKGKMYFGSAAASGTFAKFGSRDTTGTYSLLYTGTGGTAQNYNGFYAATVFGDNLYFSYWNPDATEVSLIKKYDGTTVSTSYDVTGIADVPIIALFVHDGVLYALGSRYSGGTWTSVVLTTPDGTTWTDRTGDLPLGTFTSRGVTNAFASIAY